LLQDNIGRPNTADYINDIVRDLILNCPITKEDIICAEDILGPNLGSLKGNTTRKTLETVSLDILDNLPNGLLQEYGDVTLEIDIMYINKIPFTFHDDHMMGNTFGTA